MDSSEVVPLCGGGKAGGGQMAKMIPTLCGGIWINSLLHGNRASH
jgi:hypothetical protein